METKEFKKVTKYDARSINELVKEQNKAKEEFDNTTPVLDAKIEELNNKLEELKSKNIRKMTEEEKEEYKAEKEKYKEEKKQVEKEKKQAEKYLDKYEKERERIKQKLAEKVASIETKVQENRAKIEELENKIEENDEKMQSMNIESTEYKELLKENTDATKKISRLKGNITRNNKKIQDIKEIEGNLDTWHAVDLPEMRDIKLEPRKLNGKKYTQVQKDIKIPEKIEESEEVKNETDGSVSKLEEEIRKSAARMREYKENGNYNQEALEHQYYNGLVSKMNDLKSKEQEEKQQIEPVKPEPVQTKQPTEKVKAQPVQTKQPTETVKVQPTQTKQSTVQQRNMVQGRVVVEQEKSTPIQSSAQMNLKTDSSYSEMTLEELRKKQRELFAKIIEGDDYEFRAHQENGIEGHEEDLLDKELKAVREELERRAKEENQKEQPKEVEQPKKKGFFAKLKDIFNAIKTDIAGMFNKQRRLPEPKQSNIKTMKGKNEFRRAINAYVNEGKALKMAEQKAERETRITEEKEP